MASGAHLRLLLDHRLHPLDKGYDAVLYNGSGGDAVAFVKQFVELGMHKKILLIGQSNGSRSPISTPCPRRSPAPTRRCSPPTT